MTAMGRLTMTHKELIQNLRICGKGGNCLGCELDGKCSGINNLLTDAADRLEALRTENDQLREAMKMMPKWVSVDERLPESEGMVLATFTGKIQNKEYIGGYLLAEYVPGEGWILEEYPQLENPNVTHWCELPEPPCTEGVE